MASDAPDYLEQLHATRFALLDDLDAARAMNDFEAVVYVATALNEIDEAAQRQEELAAFTTATFAEAG